uniref:PigN domain-containing protein n=1 Tax=Macrostomum lignano TaxID=282301 RepID=A0A1I8FL72_9PLAT
SILLSFALWIIFVAVQIGKAHLPGLAGQKSPDCAEPRVASVVELWQPWPAALLACCTAGAPALLYCLTPHCLALCLLSESGFLLACWRALLRRVPLTGRRTPLGFVCDLTFIIVGLELCALSFTSRLMLLRLACSGSAPTMPACCGGAHALRQHRPVVARFFASCLALCAFPLLPVVGGVVHPCCSVHTAAAAAYSVAYLRSEPDAKLIVPLSAAQCSLAGLISVSTHTVYHGRDKPLVLQAASCDETATRDEADGKALGKDGGWRYYWPIGLTVGAWHSPFWPARILVLEVLAVLGHSGRAFFLGKSETTALAGHGGPSIGPIGHYVVVMATTALSH